VSAPAWSLAILAGGQSARMGSDKAARPFAGTTLLDHAIARFAPPGAPVLLSTRPGFEAASTRAIPVKDDVPGLGPLAGIAALALRAPAAFLLVMPVDLPLFPATCGAAMAAALDGSAALAISWKGRVEPLPALVSRDLAPCLNDLLRRGLRRADSFHEPARARVVPFETLFPGIDPAAAFLNVNTPADLARAEALLASERR
jgi:molybdopterin-guanine dinucleotide biosynthesis protein A